MMIKNMKLVGLKISIVTVFLGHTNFNDDLIEHKCLICNKKCQIKFYAKLKERFVNTYKLSKHDNNKFILLLRKGVYSYDCIDNWGKLNETSLPEIKIFIVT